VLPRALTLLLSPKDFSEGFRTAGRLQKHLTRRGPVETLRALSKRGTLVFVPTHLSNLDSVVFGFALDREGLPPVSYGAGKNLFSQPLPLVLHANLGAYRVDRRIRHELYKEVLKTYSTVLIERGYHSLFFPGGTRCRSGLVEERSSSGSWAPASRPSCTPWRGHPQRVFFVPATINYLLTLEASTLIADYLAEVGRNRYIIEDDESTQLERIVTLVRKLVMTTGSVVIRFGEPIDPFTNRVTEDGRSLDPRGREVDPATYVTRDGVPVHDEARDAQYTRELGEAICRRLRHSETVLPSPRTSSPPRAFAASSATPPRRRPLQAPAPPRRGLLPGDELERRVADLVDRARAEEDRGEIVLGPGIRGATAVLVDEAVRAWSGYHTNAVLTRPRRAATCSATPTSCCTTRTASR
jgi:glycerol-3-phosphate O-acyltransferase